MGLDGDDWLVLWSGLFAAVLSAGVAVTVLLFSNQHQQKLVERQLAEQRLEASRARGRSATADFVGTISGFRTAADISVDAVEGQANAFFAAAYRWMLEMDAAPDVLEMLAWGNTLTTLASRAIVDKARAKNSETVDEFKRLELLDDAISELSAFGLRWNWTENDDVRRALWQRLKKERISLEERI